jgi:dolichyl-phosphate-mannose--protein O-mannosyl transferase
MALPPPGPRRDLAIAILFTLAAALFRLPRLGVPGEEVFDEVYHAKTALQYLNGEPPLEWVHPPTAKLLIAVGVWVFGYEPWAWRLMPALAGVALAPVFYLLARRVLVTERAAVLATVLLLCDGVYLVQSRIAMTNIFAVLFQVSAALAFVLLPAAIYVLSYWPWMRQGHELGELLPLQKSIWRYHADLRAQHPYFSKWYTWPLLYRPTWYHFKQTGDTIRGIVALGNPALWWASVPVTLWALVTGARERDPRRLLSGLGFCALYLPWGLSPRTLNYSHYLFEAIPYACLSLGTLLDRAWDGRWAALARAYLAGVVLLFLFFLPFFIALPVPAGWYFRDLGGGVRPWTWFPKWV